MKATNFIEECFEQRWGKDREEGRQISWKQAWKEGRREGGRDGRISTLLK